MRGFDAIAPVYDALAWPLGPGAIGGVQRDLLDRVPASESALVVGGGTGRIAVDLLLRAPVRRVVFLDPSVAMIARASRRAGRSGLRSRIEFRCDGIERLGPGERFDLVVTPFVLDLFAPGPFASAMDRLADAVAPGGAWLFADFVLDRAGPARRATVRGLYAFFRAACGIEASALPEFDGAFAARGFVRVAEARRARGLIAARLYRRGRD
jgi:ubiquinone/menaquinone biosynthesis C-methylase UbiE